jgi:hypothetical protein
MLIVVVCVRYPTTENQTHILQLLVEDLLTYAAPRPPGAAEATARTEFSLFPRFISSHFSHNHIR